MEIQADKMRKLVMYMDENVKKAQSSTKRADSSCARKVQKTPWRCRKYGQTERETKKVHLLQKDTLRQC